MLSRYDLGTTDDADVDSAFKPAPQCASGTIAVGSSAFDVQCGTNYAGSGGESGTIIGGDAQQNVPDMDTCINNCNGNADCVAVDYNKEAGLCYLLSSISDGSSPSDAIDSAVKTCTSGQISATVNGNTVEYQVTCNEDISGNFGVGADNKENYLDYDTGVASLQACAERCNSYPSCAAVDYYATTQGLGAAKQAGNCFYLRSGPRSGQSSDSTMTVGVNAAVAIQG